MTSLNWNALRKTAEDSTKPLPKDWYDVKATKAEATVASTGSPMIKLVLEVITGPHATRTLFTNLVVSQDSGFALNIFFRNVAAFGVDPHVVAPNGDLGSVAQALVGRTARAEVSTRTWQGQERNEVSNMAPATGNVANIATPTGPSVAVPTPGSSMTPGPVTPTTTLATTPAVTPANPATPSTDAPQLPF